MHDLRAERIGVGYGRRAVLEALDLAVPPGRLTILAGPNGSGKSTLLKTLGGLIRPAAGRVTLDGRPVAAIPPRQMARRIGLLPQAPRPLEELSGGQRQRAWIAMVLAQEAPILLLDEPTTFLDLAHQIEVLDLLRDLVAAGRTVVAVLHDLTQAARYGDHLVLLDAGRIAAAGPPAAVLTPARVQAVFGVAVTLVPAPGPGWPLCLPG